MNTSTSGREQFQEGDIVVVKGYGRARVLEGLQTDPSHEHSGRYHVQYLDSGANYFCRPDLLRRAWQGSKRIIVCQTTTDYRTAVIRCTEHTDVCLEVGCHEGVTTNMIQSRCKSVVGVDKSQVVVAAARAKFPGTRFEAVDAFDVAALKALHEGGQYDKIFVDIGGIAELHTVMALVGLYFKAFRRCKLVVKSVFLKQVLESAEVFDLC